MWEILYLFATDSLPIPAVDFFLSVLFDVGETRVPSLTKIVGLTIIFFLFARCVGFFAEAIMEAKETVDLFFFCYYSSTVPCYFHFDEHNERFTHACEISLIVPGAIAFSSTRCRDERRFRRYNAHKTEQISNIYKKGDPNGAVEVSQRV